MKTQDRSVCMAAAWGVVLGFGLDAVSAIQVVVWPEKMQVRLGEEVKLNVTVTGMAAGQKANVECRVLRQADTQVAQFEGVTDEAGRVCFVFKPGKEFGYEAVARATVGSEKVTASEVFACAQNPWLIAPSYHGNSLRYWNLSPEGAPLDPPVAKYVADWIKDCRDLYLPVTELLSVAYCPFSSIVPPVGVDNYISGQGNTVYKNSVRALRTLIGGLHSNGVYSVVYVNGSVSGMGGTEFARTHPQYLVYSSDGRLAGGINMESQSLIRQYYRDYPASLQDKELGKQLCNAEPYGLHIALQNFTDPALVEHGARALMEGRAFFGYDGVRFDGHYCVPSIGDPLASASALRDYQGNPQPGGKQGDELTGRNMKQAIDLVRKQYPDFMFGFNYASFRSDQWGDGVLESKEAQTIAPGNYILDEVAKGANIPAHPDYRWADFARHMAEESDRVRKLGGFLFGGWGGGPGHGEVDTKIVKAFAWSAGVRWISDYGSNNFSKRIPGIREYHRFAYRYSEYILNNDRTRVPTNDVDKKLVVKAGRPVVYKEFVYRIRTSHGRFLMVNLVNSPVEDFITDKAQTPPSSGPVRIAAGPELFEGNVPQADGVFVLSPDMTPQFRRLTARGEAPFVLDVPPIAYWTIVMIPY